MQISKDELGVIKIDAGKGGIISGKNPLINYIVNLLLAESKIVDRLQLDSKIDFKHPFDDIKSL